MNTDKYNNIYGKYDKVIELKYKDFKFNNKDLIIKNKIFFKNNSLIIFYAPWCKYCKKLYDDISELSITNHNKFNIGSVNINDIKNNNHLLSNFLNITSIPCAYIIKNKKLIKYNKVINYENIFYYINMNIK